MTDQLGADYGANIPGESGVTATGTTQATAYTLRRQVTVFSTVASGTGCMLPSPFNYGAGVTVMNRGANALLVYPPPGDRLEVASVNAPFSLAIGSDVTYYSFTPSLAAPPRQWWQVSSPNLSPTFDNLTVTGGATIGTGGLAVNGPLLSTNQITGDTGVFNTSLSATALSVGALGGSVGVGGWAVNGPLLSTGQTTTGQFVIATPAAPATASAAGTAGTIAWDNGFIYVAVATNTWKRVAIATW